MIEPTSSRKPSSRAAVLALLLVCAACSDAPPPGAANAPPPNPFLARSAYAIGHGDSAQSDSSPVRGATPVEAMDEALAGLDTLTGAARQTLALQLAARYPTGLGGVYYVLEVDNGFYVGGTEEIVKYVDAAPSGPASAIVEAARWRRPDSISGEFEVAGGMRVALDEHLAATAHAVPDESAGRTSAG